MKGRLLLVLLSLAASEVLAGQPTDAKLAAAPPAADGKGRSLYTVMDGYKVDHETMQGFRTWRAAACDRCHGPNQEGMVGPSLIESLKRMSREEFAKTLAEGRLEKGMPSWQTNKQVMENMDQLYAYLKGRSDGAISRTKVQEIE
jgi:mono/diheme cytochrome c family protein